MYGGDADPFRGTSIRANMEETPRLSKSCTIPNTEEGNSCRSPLFACKPKQCIEEPCQPKPSLGAPPFLLMEPNHASPTCVWMQHNSPVSMPMHSRAKLSQSHTLQHTEPFSILTFKMKLQFLEPHRMCTALATNQWSPTACVQPLRRISDVMMDSFMHQLKIAGSQRSTHTSLPEATPEAGVSEFDQHL